MLGIRRALTVILAEERARQLAAHGPRIRASRARTRNPIVVTCGFERVEGCVVLCAVQVFVVVDADIRSGWCDVEEEKGGKEECC